MLFKEPKNDFASARLGPHTPSCVGVLLHAVCCKFVLTTSLRCSSDFAGPMNLGIERNHCRARTSLQAPDSLGINTVGSSGSNILSWAHRRMSYPPPSLLGSVGAGRDTLFQETKVASPSCSPSSPSSYRRLSRDIYGNPMFSTCSKCGGKYTNPGMCASHEATCNGTNRLKCNICNRVYSQMCALKEHLRGKHGLGEMLTCRLCGRSFKYKPQLYDHSCSGVNPKDKQSSRSSESHALSGGSQPLQSSSHQPATLVKSELTDARL